MTLSRRSLLYGAGAAAVPIGRLAAQQWPARTIRMLVGTAPGGSPDIVARILGEKLADRLGVSVVVENMMQAAGAVAYETVSRSPADGYTMGIITAGYPPQAVLRRRTLVYDPVDGYYTRSAGQLGPAGDFYTAAHVGPLLGAAGQPELVAGDGDRGREALQVPLEGARQRLVEVVDVEVQAALGRVEDPEVGEVRVTTDLGREA